MKSAQVTIKDIARELGISPSTVSRALKDHPDISPATKKAVNELAKKWHYEPNAIALSLKRSKSYTIGLLIPEIRHYFFSSVISGIEDVAYDAGYQVMICQSNELYEREVKNTHALLSSRVDGLLVSLSKETRNFDHFKSIERSHIPIVFFDRVCDEVLTDRVYANDYEGAFFATEHLIQMSCKRIAHLAAPQELLIGKNRQNGYLHALRRYNIKEDDSLILKCDKPEIAEHAVDYLFSLAEPPDGIFAVNDLTAIQVMLLLKKKGIKIPDDLAIVGFSNGQYSQMTDPTLSTVEQHGFEMGQKAAQLLLDRFLLGQDYPAKTEIIKTKLIVRESSQRLSKK